MIHFTHDEGWEEKGEGNSYVPKHANISIPIIPPLQWRWERGEEFVSVQLLSISCITYILQLQCTVRSSRTLIRRLVACPEAKVTIHVPGLQLLE